MKSFVVVGIGRFGSYISRTLAELGNDVLVIDSDEEKVQKISEYVTYAVSGDVTDESILRSLGIRNYDVGIVAISEDMGASILVTTLLKELGIKHVVARAISDMHGKILEKVGADKVIFIEREMGKRLAQSIAVANIMDYIELSDEYSIIEVKVPAKWINKSLKSLNVRVEYGINVVAIREAGAASIDVPPSPEYLMQENDVLVVIGSNDDISSIND